jgi:hypothetical protein
LLFGAAGILCLINGAIIAAVVPLGLATGLLFLWSRDNGKDDPLDAVFGRAASPDDVHPRFGMSLVGWEAYAQTRGGDADRWAPDDFGLYIRHGMARFNLTEWGAYQRVGYEYCPGSAKGRYIQLGIENDETFDPAFYS